MLNIKGKYVESKSYNPWFNLALEEYLLENVKDNEIIMYLWQNDNTVVIGKNQNPWRECRLKELEGDKGKLARRLSGGGAVYHDLGNLNFTFIMKNSLYNLENQLGIIIKSLKKLGISAEFSGRNDIVVDGRKISGNAFYFTEDASLHHGTLLVNANMEKLSNYLQVSKEKIASKGVDSVKSRVINLSSISPSITIEGIGNKLKETFYERYSVEEELILMEGDFEEDRMYKKYSSWKWIYGETPDFDITLNTRFSWGGIEIALKLEGAYISRAIVYSDAMNYRIIDKLSNCLNGIPFTLSEIIDAIKGISASPLEEDMIEDICNWILSKGL